MLKSTSQFITLLRKDKIAAPTVRNFSPEQWARDYLTYGTGELEEQYVYDAGLWIGAQLKHLWAKINDMKLSQYRFNSFIATLQAIFIKNYRSVSVEFGQDSIANTWGEANYKLTALGDSLWRALNFLGSQRTLMTGSKSPSENEVFQLLKACSEIYPLEYFMGRVIHCGWRLQEENGIARFEPSVAYDYFLRNEAIAINLRDEEMFEFLTVYQAAWDQGKLRNEAPYHAKLLQRTGTRAAFSIIDSPPEKMPFTIPLFASDIPQWMQGTLEMKASNVENISVMEILSGWLWIALIFSEIDEFERRTPGSSEFGCGLSERDLIEALKLAGRTERQARIVTNFLTYSWKPHEDLWGSPLIKIGDIYFPFLPALLDSNLTRTVDLWLKKCKYTTPKGKLDEIIGSRGLVFEQHVRTELKSYMQDCSYVDGFVHPDASKMVGGDIDLFWRMDNLVIVADTKFNKFPANPNEIGNYYRELEHGAAQVLERIGKLEHKRSEVANLLHWRGKPEELVFQPLVVCGHPFGAGLSFNDVPCIQFSMLELLFDRHHFSMYARADGIARSEDIEVPFVKQQGKFIDFFKKYIASPVPVWFREPGLIQEEMPSTKLPEGILVKFKQWSVNISNNENRKTYCIERQYSWSRDFISTSA